LNAGHLIEVGIVTKERQSVLAYQGGDPEVVFRYRLASLAKLMPDFRVNAAGFGSDVKDGAVSLQIIQPFLASRSLAGRLDSVPVFAQHDDWQRDSYGRVLKMAENACVRVCEGGNGVGIEDHFQSSGLILSNSSSTSS
jgi:hypothetical protein